jgi:hypothetical protein
MHSVPMYSRPQITRTHASSMNAAQMVNNHDAIHDSSFSVSQYNLVLEPRKNSINYGRARPRRIIQDPRSLAFVNQTRSASFSSAPQAIFVQAYGHNLQGIEAHMEQNYLANMYPGNMQGFNGNPYPIGVQYIQRIPYSNPLNTQTIDEERCEEAVSQVSYDFRILSHDIESLSADASYFKVDPSFPWEKFVSDPGRRAIIIRWKQKKADFLKSASPNQYQVRTDVANRRPRIRGRFLPKSTS